MLNRLVQATVKAGGNILKLTPGRQMVVVTATGEREVRGETQTAASIEGILAPVLPPGWRQLLAQGPAAWDLDVASIGKVRLHAEGTADGVGATITLIGPGIEAPPAEPVPQPADDITVALRAEWSGDIEELFRFIQQIGASDLHLSVGSPPMLRHDGEMRALADAAALGTDLDRCLTVSASRAPWRARRHR